MTRAGWQVPTTQPQSTRPARGDWQATRPARVDAGRRRVGRLGFNPLARILKKSPNYKFTNFSLSSHFSQSLVIPSSPLPFLPVFLSLSLLLLFFLAWLLSPLSWVTETTAWLWVSTTQDHRRRGSVN